MKGLLQTTPFAFSFTQTFPPLGEVTSPSMEEMRMDMYKEHLQNEQKKRNHQRI
jgi:hypothetical protein